ncbi:MAG: glutaredoxin domain-containing protein [Candidatus Paceibacterota bacterium]
MADNKNVVIYSSPNCVHCNHAKEYFKENNIEYTDYDVASNQEKRQEMVEKSGQMGVPVIYVGDEMVVGFDQGRIEQLLSA